MFAGCEGRIGKRSRGKWRAQGRKGCRGEAVKKVKKKRIRTVIVERHAEQMKVTMLAPNWIPTRREALWAFTSHSHSPAFVMVNVTVHRSEMKLSITQLFVATAAKSEYLIHAEQMV